jgi:hypothetical protein
MKSEVLIKLIVGVVKLVTIDELGPADYLINSNERYKINCYFIHD